MLVRAIVAVMGLLVVTQLTPVLAQTGSPSPQAAPPGAAAPTVNSPVRTVPTVPSPPESDDARYSFHRVQDGYLRLDSNTGRVALCSRRQVGWACQVLPDDRIVLENEIARMQNENGALKKALLSRGLPLPSGVSAPPAARNKGEARPPGGSVFNQFMSLVAATWLRLVEVVARIQRDMSSAG